MEKLRYNRAFQNGIVAIIFFIILFWSVIAFFVISKIQYDQLVSDMESLEATIVDVDRHVRRKGLNWQDIYIEYAVDGIVYNRELKKCYKQASKITGQLFYLPILREDVWQITAFKNGEERTLSLDQFRAFVNVP